MNNFSPFYRTRRIITMFTESCDLPRPEFDETNQLHLPYSFKNLFNIILPTTPRSPRGLLPSSLLVKNLYSFFFCPYILYLTHPSSSFGLIKLILFREEYKSWSSSLCRLSMLLLLGSSWAWSCCSASYFRKTSAHIHPLKLETKFHTVWNNRQNYSCI